MKGLLKKVAGAFVEMDDSSKPVESVINTQTPVMPITGSDLLVSLHLDSTLVDQFRRQFASILEEENKRNYPGNDYFEFKVMKDAMNLIPDEGMRYIAAFAGWKVGGNQTKKSLIDTANIYLGLVDREISEFEQAYEIQYKEKVVKNEGLINQKMEEIRRLTDQVHKLNQEVLQLKQDNTASTATLKSRHDAFMAAGQAQRSEILSEIDKINKYVN